jgi:hypothetical protein
MGEFICMKRCIGQSFISSFLTLSLSDAFRLVGILSMLNTLRVCIQSTNQKEKEKRIDLSVSLFFRAANSLARRKKIITRVWSTTATVD